MVHDQPDRHSTRAKAINICDLLCGGPFSNVTMLVSRMSHNLDFDTLTAQSMSWSQYLQICYSFSTLNGF